MSPIVSCRNVLVPPILSLGILLAGCSGSREPAVTPADEVKLEVIDDAGFAKLLADNRGKVVLIDFWATWCDSCIELFPHTVELHKKYADRGLSVISIGLDDEEAKARALKILKDKQTTFPNYISRFGAGDKSSEVFDIKYGLPHLKLYDRQGKLHKTFPPEGESIDPEQIDQAIEGLL